MKLRIFSLLALLLMIASSAAAAGPDMPSVLMRRQPREAAPLTPPMPPTEGDLNGESRTNSVVATPISSSSSVGGTPLVMMGDDGMLTEWSYVNAEGELEINESAGAVIGDYDDEYSGPTWTIRAGAVILNRRTPAANTILAGAPGVGLNANSFEFNTAGGPDITLRRDCGDWGGEFRYFGVDSFSSSQTALNGTLAVGYDSAIHSSEFNVRRNRDVFTWLLGFRHVALYEQMNASLVGAPAGMLSTSNRLYGVQGGIEGTVWNITDCLRVDGSAKAGLYGNSVDHNLSILGGPGISQRSSPAAFVGDVGATAIYTLSDRWSIRGGYQLLWLSGVALASDQASFPSIISTNASGNTLFHGATVGFDFVW
ncbi:MAG TPA: hypothetical protein PLV92_05305 [Pirellulaceae bacterium]|nr:hypothetical protein [Pirellulaceae bacterium]